MTTMFALADESTLSGHTMLVLGDNIDRSNGILLRARKL